MSDIRTLIDSYYNAWFRFHPEVAVDLGIAGYSELLTPCDENDIGALTALNEKLIDAVEELNTEGLDANQQIDLKLMQGAALLELKQLIERDWRYRNPARFLPIHAIYQLTLRTVADQHQALAARLTAIPAYLRTARGYLRTEPQLIPPIWLEAAVSEALHGAEYFRSLRKHPVISQYSLDSLIDDAAHAVEDYATFLQKELAPQAKGDFACGREHFELLLLHRHGLELSADELHAFGQRLFDETLEQLKAQTMKVHGDEDVQALTAEIQKDHPPAEQLLSYYRDGMTSARQFLEQQGLVSLPQQEELKVVETPIFLRHQIPFAAYVEPAFNDPQQRGLYYVTPASDEAALGEHNFVSVQHTCVHEAWPGHHLQFVTAHQHPVAHTLPRLVNPSATLYEGWALYCEQLMVEQGFLQSSESQFVLLKDRLWRALRIMLDVELHCRGLSVDAAAERMQTTLGFTREQAMADLSWYTQAPTVPMGYGTGWALITATRERLSAVQDDFSLRSFHDGLLSAGSLALAHVIRTQFGDPLWESVQRSVFKND